MVLDNSQNEFHDMHENKMSFVDFLRTNPHLQMLTKDLEPASFFSIDNLRRVSSKDPRHLAFMHSPQEGSSPIRFAFDFFLQNINLRFPSEDEITKGKAFGLHFYDSWSRQEPNLGLDNFDCISRLQKLHDNVFYHTYRLQGQDYHWFKTGQQQAQLQRDELVGEKLALPGFDHETFPFIVGMNKAHTEVHLFNTKTWHSQLLLRLPLMDPRDRISQLFFTAVCSEINPFKPLKPGRPKLAPIPTDEGAIKISVQNFKNSPKRSVQIFQVTSSDIYTLESEEESFDEEDSEQRPENQQGDPIGVSLHFFTETWLDQSRNVISANQVNLGPDVMHALRICGHLPPSTLNDLFLMIEKVKTHEQAKQAPARRGPMIIDVEESKDTMTNGITMKEEDILTARNAELRMTTPGECLNTEGNAAGMLTGRGRTMVMPRSTRLNIGG